MTDKIQLYFFPFAGASFYSYNPLVNALPQNLLDIMVLELPGRGKRSQAPLLSDLHDMAADLFHQIKDTIRPPYIFFGHSLGSLLAYEVILKILDAGLDLPTHLTVSGRGGPMVPPRDRDIRHMSSKRFYELLKEYGGTPAQVFREKELMAFFEPVLRADFMAAGAYTAGKIRKLPLSVTVFNGTQDRVTREDALKWQEVTDIPVTLKEFTGKHFFIFDHVAAICQAIVQPGHFN